jgi:hypothetical protein
MALPVNRPNSEYVVSNQLADISAASSTYAVATAKGKLKRAYSVLHGAITGADCTWVLKINGTTVTGTVTVAYSGSAAGDIDSVEYDGLTRVNEGDLITWTSAGESSTTAIATFFAVIEVG